MAAAPKLIVLMHVNCCRKLEKKINFVVEQLSSKE